MRQSILEHKHSHYLLIQLHDEKSNAHGHESDFKMKSFLPYPKFEILNNKNMSKIHPDIEVKVEKVEYNVRTAGVQRVVIERKLCNRNEDGWPTASD